MLALQQNINDNSHERLWNNKLYKGQTDRTVSEYGNKRVGTKCTLTGKE
jgi:hypothetical protein